MMNMELQSADGWHKNRWRILGWGTALALLLTPLVAMQFTREVQWTGSDFVFAALMFATVGGLLELAVRMTRNSFYRAGAAFAVLSAFLLVWANGAIGLIGNGDHPVNTVFMGVPLIALAGSALARFKARGMAQAMFAAGAVQAGLATVFGIFGSDMRGGIWTVIISGLWLLSGALFRAADARQRAA